MPDPFPSVSFKGQLRPSQKEVVDIARDQLAAGEEALHIVAPPGSGKTILGLYLWAHHIRRPCLVLSPNSAIQSQWAARIEMFDYGTNKDVIVSTCPETPRYLTSLTYQSVTIPVRKNDSIEAQARQIWQDKLIETSQAADSNEASIWIDGLEKNNPGYFNERLSIYAKQIRHELSMTGQSLSLLHSSSAETLKRIADIRPGVLILDECHHLVGHWGRVLSAAHEMLGNPVIVGLTATPPDLENKDPRDVERYASFFGPVDYEVPIPAVVKDGFLAPYQDLAWFVSPSEDELEFVAGVDQTLHRLIDDLCAAPTNEDSSNEDSCLISWIQLTLSKLKLPTGNAESWAAFEKSDPTFATAACWFLIGRNLSLPVNVPPPEFVNAGDFESEFEYLVPILDRYVRHHLRRSSNPDDHAIGDRIVGTLRTLGVQITETGIRACSSPVSRVLAYSQKKNAAAISILKREVESLGDAIRAVIVTDFERSSAVSAELKNLMDEESGGAVAAFKTLLTDETTDRLEPILVTGSTVLIDDEIEEQFLAASRKWLSERSLSVVLDSRPIHDFRQIVGRGRDWSPRIYIEMITELFQQGLTKCLVGTRGLLGEGWDANRINVLIDLTTVTTSMSINQLRGRSFRLDPAWPEKVANNWDVVCIAPEFQKGFDDYRRFSRKHQNLYGVTDDGAIEKGVGHVHPAFTEIEPEGLEGTTALLNEEMLYRASRRSHCRELWKIGSPYQSLSANAVEFKRILHGSGGFPPFKGKKIQWKDDTLVHAIGVAVLDSLADAGLVSASAKLNHGILAGGYVRVFVAEATESESELFAKSMSEVLGPLENSRYVIERLVSRSTETLLSRILPEIVGRYFRKRHRELAMLHTVPSALAKNRELVNIFTRHWNTHVSPGKAIFSQRGKGLETVKNARSEGLQASPTIHEKEIFL